MLLRWPASRPLPPSLPVPERFLGSRRHLDIATAALLATLAGAQRGQASSSRATAARRARERNSPAEELKIPTKDGIHELTTGGEQRTDIVEGHYKRLRNMQLDQFNNVLKHRRKGSRRLPPKLKFGKTPDNPWRDRYLLCADCERRADYRSEEPLKDCNCSSLLELDLTAPFTPDNVMVVSCKLVQAIREDRWASKTEDGKFQECDKSRPEAFPVQVCANCRQTTLEQGRRFQSCPTCRGAHYCSDACFAKHRLKHRASCTEPTLPHRTEWGVRPELREMRNQMYPLIGPWAIRAPNRHMIAWRRPMYLDHKTSEKKLLSGGDSTDAPVVKRLQMGIPAARRRRSTVVETSPEQLLIMNMTEAEFRARQEELARVPEEAALSTVVPQPSRFDSLTVTPAAVEEEETPRLTPEAVERVDAAAREAAQEAAPAWRPSWAEDEEPPPAPWEVTTEEKPPIERKPGVVYPPSDVEQIAEKYDVRLSPEAVARLEAAAAEAEALAAGKAWPKERIDIRKKNRMMM